MHNGDPTNTEYQAWLQSYNARMRAWRLESYALQDRAKRLGIMTATCLAALIISLIGMRIGAIVTCVAFGCLSEFIRFRLIRKAAKIDDMRMRASSDRRYYNYG